MIKRSKPLRYVLYPAGTQRYFNVHEDNVVCQLDNNIKWWIFIQRYLRIVDKLQILPEQTRKRAFIRETNVDYSLEFLNLPIAVETNKWSKNCRFWETNVGCRQIPENGHAGSFTLTCLVFFLKKHSISNVFYGWKKRFPLESH